MAKSKKDFDEFDAEKYLHRVTKQVASKIQEKHRFSWTNEMTVAVYKQIEKWRNMQIHFYAYRHTSLSITTRIAEILLEFAKPASEDSPGIFISPRKKDEEVFKYFKLPPFHYSNDDEAKSWIFHQVKSLIISIDKAENPKKSSIVIQHWPESLLKNVDLNKYRQHPEPPIIYSEMEAKKVLEAHNLFAEYSNGYVQRGGRKEILEKISNVMGAVVNRLPKEYAFVKAYCEGGGNEVPQLSNQEFTRIKREFEKVLAESGLTVGDYPPPPEGGFSVTDELLKALDSVPFPDARYPPNFTRKYLEAMELFYTYQHRYSDQPDPDDDVNSEDQVEANEKEQSVLEEMNDIYGQSWRRFPGCNQFLRAFISKQYQSNLVPVSFYSDDNEITKVHRNCTLILKKYIKDQMEQLNEFNKDNGGVHYQEEQHNVE